ncbi:MAG: cyclic nucleotide-binding domain-containing protein [Chloroflexota bacterium]
MAVIGKSGSGKSTLINTITGIDRPNLGEVWVGGVPIHTLDENQIALWRGRHLGVIFQFFQLLPTLTLLENIMLPMEFSRLYTPKERQARARHLLELVEMVDQADKLPANISGGQQQRVAIARALANDPPILVADEPTGSLDTKTADSIFQLFENLVAQGKSILMVTHDRDLASRVSRVVLISDGEIVDHYVSEALGTLTEAQMVQLSARLEPITYPAGSTVFEQGDDADNFYIIVKGEVDIIRAHSSGPEILTATIDSGQYFGEIGLLKKEPRSATARVTDSGDAVLLSVDREMFQQLVNDSALTHDNIAQLMRQRLTSTQFMDLYADQLAEFEASHQLLTYEPGDIIIHRDDIADKFYLILKGEVEVFPNDESDEVIDRLDSGQYFGEVGLFKVGSMTKPTRTATVRAARDFNGTIEVIAISGDDFGNFVSASQMTHDEIAQVVARRRLVAKLADFGFDMSV